MQHHQCRATYLTVHLKYNAFIKRQTMVKSEFFTRRSSKRLKLASQVAHSFGSTISDAALEISKGKTAPQVVKVKKEPEAIDLEVKNHGNHTKRTVTVKTEEDQKLKIEDSPIPKNFYPIYNEVKLIRSKITTPVDSMGCATIPVRIAEEKTGPLFRYRLLVSLMLSSQTKDEVNYEVMKNMNDYFKSVGYENGLCLQAILDVEPSKLDELIHKIGFHNRKTIYLKSAAVIVKEQYNGDIPQNIKQITALPGVGPKMGYLLLQDAWGINDGIGVDVHVDRLANMWKWVNTKTPEQTRLALEKWLPRDLWQEINPVLVGFGQVICTPRGRRCDICSLASKKLCNNIDRGIISKSRREKESAALRGTTIKEKKIRGDVSKILDIEDLA